MSTINPRVVLFSVVITKLIFDRIYRLASVINPAAGENGAPVLDILEYGHPASSDEIYRVIGFYGPKGREAYLQLAMYDTGFVLIRLLPLCVFAQWSMGKYPKIASALIYFHVFAAAWDILENLILFIVLKAFPRRYDALASLLCTWISIKWYLLYATGATVAGGLLVGLYHSFHSLLADSVLMEKDRTNPKPQATSNSKQNASKSTAKRSKKDN
ncbi:hypothetical protein NQZ79_g885 [Umbelopsis isabellina]|nr:hypothetical protein NQZ79_g885 [Umbelopsis isabellina]